MCLCCDQASEDGHKCNLKELVFLSVEFGRKNDICTENMEEVLESHMSYFNSKLKNTSFVDGRDHLESSKEAHNMYDNSMKKARKRVDAKSLISAMMCPCIALDVFGSMSFKNWKKVRKRKSFKVGVKQGNALFEDVSYSMGDDVCTLLNKYKRMFEELGELLQSYEKQFKSGFEDWIADDFSRDFGSENSLIALSVVHSVLQQQLHQRYHLDSNNLQILLPCHYKKIAHQIFEQKIVYQIFEATIILRPVVVQNSKAQIQALMKYLVQWKGRPNSLFLS